MQIILRTQCGSNYDKSTDKSLWAYHESHSYIIDLGKKFTNSIQPLITKLRNLIEYSDECSEVLVHKVEIIQKSLPMPDIRKKSVFSIITPKTGSDEFICENEDDRWVMAPAGKSKNYVARPEITS